MCKKCIFPWVRKVINDALFPGANYLFHESDLQITNCASLAESYTGPGVLPRECPEKSIAHIFPMSNYSDALVATGLLSLEERRNSIRHAYVQKLRKQDHPINFLLPREEPVQHTYNLRSGNNMNKFLYGNKKICRTKCSDHFYYYF